VLGFFARVEAKASFVFAADTSMLALIALNLRYEDFSRWQIVVPAVFAVIGIAASVVFVYRCSFPNLSGGHQSLIYFAEIAKRRESAFVDEFLKVDEGALIRDVVGQVWRNSEILSLKFRAIKVSFILTALSLIPFFLFLAAATIYHPQLPIVK
jgi:hypothetical protein